MAPDVVQARFQAPLEDVERDSSDGDGSEDGWDQLHPDDLLMFQESGFTHLFDD